MFEVNRPQIDDPKIGLIKQIELELINFRTLKNMRIDRRSQAEQLILAHAGTQIQMLEFILFHLKARQYFDSEIEELQRLLTEQLLEKDLQSQKLTQIKLMLTLLNNYKLKFSGMSRINKHQVGLLSAILKSKTFFDYLQVRHGIKENNLIKNKSIELEIYGCQQYFAKQEFIVFDQIALGPQRLMGISLPNQWIMISQQSLSNDVSSLLLLLHLYFQIVNGSHHITLSEFVIQQQCFYSELWSFQFVPGLFLGTLLDDLNKVDFWKMNSFDCAKQISNSQINKQQYLPANQFLNHNQTIKLTIQQIKIILSDIITLPLNTLYTKYQVDGQNKPKLHRYYSNLQYWYSLYLQIQLCAVNKWRVLFLKAYNIRVRQENFLLNILDVMLQTEKVEQYLLLEQLFFWLFQYDFGTSIDFISCFIWNCINKSIDSYTISLQDRMLIQTIIQSEGMRNAVLQINRINDRQFNERDLQAEYDELMEFLKTTKVIRFHDSTVDGISLISGRIGLSAIECFDEQNSIRKRALRIVTILHEVFAHKKRREYVSPENVLELSPLELKTQKKMKPEAGFYLETKVFGGPIDIVSDQQAFFILNSLNWSLNEVNFKLKYKQICEANQQQKDQIQQQQIIPRHIIPQFLQGSRILMPRPNNQNQEIRKSTRCPPRLE